MPTFPYFKSLDSVKRRHSQKRKFTTRNECEFKTSRDTLFSGRKLPLHQSSQHNKNYSSEVYYNISNALVRIWERGILQFVVSIFSQETYCILSITFRKKKKQQNEWVLSSQDKYEKKNSNNKWIKVILLRMF